MFSEKITLLNQTVLDCLNAGNEQKIIQEFTEAGVQTLGADFGFAWLDSMGSKVLELVYKSPGTPYTPKEPRPDGKNHEVIKNSSPYFVERVEKRDDEYDVSPYMRSFVILPIHYKGTTYGNIVLCFVNARGFSAEDKILCSFIGNAAAQAITINRLMKREQAARVDSENQKAHFRALIENSYEVIALISAEGQINYMSPSAFKISGYEPDYLKGRHIADFIYPKDLDQVNQSLKETLEQPQSPHTLEFRYIHKDGSTRWLESTAINMLTDPNVASIVVNIRDVTERKAAEEIILQQALQDPLTGLPNRKEFSIRLEQALESAKRHKRMLAVMFVDMDRFKNINDTLGHGVGDTLLKVAATRLSSCVRAEDTAARFGGDEFLILLNEIHSSQEAAMGAEKILKAMALPVQIGEHTLHPSASIGIAVYPHDGEDRASLKKHADIALYRAKENGRNGYSLYDQSMNIYASEKFALENQLRQAINSGQIILYYQPIVNLKTHKLQSVEALARWRHPTRGLLLPGEFIPLAEESGLIVPLSELILRQACLQHRVWQEEGLDKFRVAINLSANSFSENEFLTRLAKMLKECQIDGAELDLEITESVAMGNLDLTNFNLKQLKKMGVRITIDDFGTGYSSLSYLKRFPVNNLKIDRSFVRHCITNEQDAGIVRTIVSMAHNLNLKVIAEGVETEQQLNFVTSLGCNAAQGFYIGQPMPAEELPAWIAKSKHKKKVVAV